MLSLYGAIIAIALLVIFASFKSWSKRPLPPGPKGRWPFLGMTFDLPAGKPWEYLESWARYGSGHTSPVVSETHASYQQGIRAIDPLPRRFPAFRCR